MDNRRQPENSEVEQPERRENEMLLRKTARLRPYPRRNRQKQRLEQEVMPSVSQRSEESLRRRRRRSHSRVSEARRSLTTPNLATPLRQRQNMQEPGAGSPQPRRLLRRQVSAEQMPTRSRPVP